MTCTYKPGITVITPTGYRAEALERCAFYISRQTIQPNEWVICDDGPDNSPPISHPSIYLKRPSTDNKAKSFTGNVLNCLAHVSYDHVFIFEDDDWYHPRYIEHYMEHFKDVLLLGEKKAFYYNVKLRKYRVNGNTDRASFCQTAFKSSFICKVMKLCEKKRDSAFVDARIWKYARENGIPNRLLDTRLCIGIKGMPGRKGIGIGHRPGGSFTSDRNWEVLKHRIGEDAQYYIDRFP